MGIETAIILGALAIGTGFLGSQQEQASIEAAHKAQDKELRRQQDAQAQVAREERSDRVREMDRRIASALVGFQSLGGAGSVNEARAVQAEAAAGGLDLARISANRAAQISSLQSQKRASRDQSFAAIRKSQANFLSSALQTGAGMFAGSANAASLADAETAATGVQVQE